jgi:hypothetical protein
MPTSGRVAGQPIDPPHPPHPPHPSPYSWIVLAKIAELCEASFECLDPMAGIGRCHWLAEHGYVKSMVGLELEPEWAAQHPNTIHWNVLHIDKLFVPESFDAVIVSPVYGNRLSDHHDARETCKLCHGTGALGAGEPCSRCEGQGYNRYRRITYRHYLGRALSPGNSGAMQWGPAYRSFHEEAWAKVVPLLRPGGVFILNTKDHIRRHELQPVTQFHIDTLRGLGLTLDPDEMYPVDTPGMRYGENHEKRVAGGEWVIVFRKRKAGLRYAR